MVTINSDSSVVTLVVVMHVDPAMIDEKVDHVRRMAHQHAKQPGFVSCTIHKTPDDTQIIEYIQWASREHLDAVRQTFPSAGPQPPGFAHRIEGGLVEVLEVVESSDHSATEV